MHVGFKNVEIRQMLSSAVLYRLFYLWKKKEKKKREAQTAYAESTHKGDTEADGSFPDRSWRGSSPDRISAQKTSHKYNDKNLYRPLKVNTTGII